MTIAPEAPDTAAGGIGTSPRRKEDAHLVTGQTAWTDNLAPVGTLHMAFVRSPDNISVELLQKGAALTPAEPWVSMPNTGHW